MRVAIIATCFACVSAHGLEAQTSPKPPPVIDVHLHAMPPDAFGPPPADICIGNAQFVPSSNPAKPEPVCSNPVHAPKTAQEMTDATVAALEQFNVVGIASGDPAMVSRFKSAAPKRIISGLMFGSPQDMSVDSMRALYKRGGFAVFAEVVTQYAGIAPNDSVMEPYWALAEELGFPVGIHMGLGPPGAPYIGDPRYRGRLSNPLLLEDVLVKHPKLRLYVMHAGWPQLDEMINLLYVHPQVYVDVAVIDYFLPRAEFYTYLKRLVEAGFGTRIMYGSDNMLWPQAIGESIRAIQNAPFLSEKQKRDILYNNAVRFFKMDDKMTVP